jgi:hypothetical protein
MNQPPHRCDVAFSFLTADLSTAEQLADLIDPLSSFVFRRQQEEIAGTDGMEKFGAVFGTESRVNVILYRAGDGEKGWTGYESQVIKGRCLREGWDGFALLRMDGSAVPKWIPPTYIYGDIATMDTSGLAGVIRHRAKAIGIDVRRQTTADRIARHACQVDFDAETERLATRPDSFTALRSNQQRIYDRICEHITRVPVTIGGDSGFDAGVFGANLGHIGVRTVKSTHPASLLRVGVADRVIDERRWKCCRSLVCGPQRTKSKSLRGLLRRTRWGASISIYPPTRLRG